MSPLNRLNRPGLGLASVLLAAALILAGCAAEAPMVAPAGGIPPTQPLVSTLSPSLPEPAATASRPTETPNRAARDPTNPPALPIATALPTLSTAASPPATPASQPTPSTQPANPTILGYSTGGRPIEVYQYGSGPRSMALIGGIHGGYEWNTILLAYEAIDYFTDHPEAVPESVRLYIIPAANPDGQALVTGTAGRFTEKEVGPDTFDGRFNQNQVDLNRNWDCEWKPTAFWRQRMVSAGKEPFSEIETQLLRDFLTQTPVEAAIFWHSAAGAVFPGGCGERSALSDELALLYAKSAGYAYLPEFDSYDVDGDATNWLAQQGIASLSVELSNHEDTEWKQNLKGVQALMDYFSTQKAEK